MTKLIFDTYEFIKRLTAAGMPLAQAETLSDLQAQLIDERLATKDDLAQKFAHVHKDISELRKDMDTRFELADKATDVKISKLKDTLVAWIIGTFLTQMSLIVGLFKFLPTSSAAV